MRDLYQSCAICPQAWRCYGRRRCYLTGERILTISEALPVKRSAGNVDVGTEKR